MSWSLCQLDSVCERVSVGHVGTTSKFYTDDSGVPFLRTQNINSEGIILNDVKFITPEFHSKLKKSTLFTGDVVLSRVISTAINCGIIPEALNGGNCANIILARPKNNVLDSRYLMHYLRSEYAQKELLKRQVGSAQSVVNTSVLKSWKIPLPPLTEQKRIAAILDKADTIRRKRQQAIQLADDFLRAVFLDMFGDPVTNPKGWTSMPLGEVATFTSGGTPMKKRADYWNGEFPWVSPKDMKKRIIIDAIDHISEIVFEETPLKRIARKAVLLVVRGMILAHTVPIAITGREVAINQDMKAIVPKGDLQPEFLLWALLTQHDFILSKVSNAAHGTCRLEMSDIQSLPIPMADNELRKKFVEINNKFAQFKNTQVDTVQNADVLFNSLSQRAFRGEL